MKILVVGGGGREHAIIKKLKESLPSQRFLPCPATAVSLRTPPVCPSALRTWTALCSLSRSILWIMPWSPRTIPWSWAVWTG